MTDTTPTIVDLDLDLGVHEIARVVDVHSPDTSISPGSRLLVRILSEANSYDPTALHDAVAEFVDGGGEPDDFGPNDLPAEIVDDLFEIADSCVQIYTYQCWEEFTDLCLWNEDLSDYEVDGDDLTRSVAMTAQLEVARRGLPVLLARRAVAIYSLAHPEDEDEE